MTGSSTTSPLLPMPTLYPAARGMHVSQDPSAALSVAIIMRTKNRTLLLHRALASVLLQTHQAWHLYLVNDGGERPELEAVIARYAPAFGDRLSIIHHEESLGMERASNAALGQTTEDFVVVHDDDDSWHPHFLSTTAAFLANPRNKHYIGVTTGGAVVNERIEDGQVLEFKRVPWTHDRDLIDFRSILVVNQFPPICLMFRRCAVQTIGGFNDEMPMLGDWEFNLRLLLLGDVGFINRDLARYHHRVKCTNSAYRNTRVDGNGLRRSQNVRLRNGMLRAALSDRPEMLGLLQPILQKLADDANRQHDASERILKRLEHDARRQDRVSERMLERLEHDARRQDRVSERILERQEQMLERQKRILERLEILNRVEGTISELRNELLEVRTVANWHRKMLRPIQWLWFKTLPVRRAVARARGRI